MKVNIDFKFIKVQWFYEVYLNNELICKLTKEGNKWNATGSHSNLIYKGKTRQEAATNYFKDNHENEYERIELQMVKDIIENNNKIINTRSK